MFTPNKTLGRNIYDFTATATEIGAIDAETLNKYQINLLELHYILNAQGALIDNYVITPYIDPMYYKVKDNIGCMILIAAEVL